MANLTTVISADTSKFVSGIKSAQDTLDKFIKETNVASDSTKKNIVATDEQVAAYQRVIKQLDKVSSGTMSTSQQQKALSDQIKELKVQWQNLSDNAKSSDFGKSMSNTMKLATDELGKLKTQLASIDDIKPAEKVKTQLRQTTELIQNLSVQYAQLSATEKTSPFGVQLAQQMEAAKKKAGSLKDVIADVDQEIKILSSDTPHLDAFNQGLSVGADIVSTYVSLMAKLSGDSEKYKDVITTVALVQSAANLSTKVANQLQSSSILMIKIRKVQEAAAATAIKIRTAAETKGTIATKGATVAQAAFNAVAKANPYVLLATVILAAGAALFTFIKRNKEAKEAEAKHQEQLKKDKEAFEDYANEVGSAGGNLLAKFNLLKEEYQSLSTQGQKLEWIKKNKDAFSELGISVDSVSDAEKIYVQNTDTVVNAIIKRAQAAAKQTQINQLAERMLAEREKAEAEYAKKKVSAGSVSRGSSHTTEGGNEYIDRNSGKWVYTAKGAEEANKKIKQETYAVYNTLEKEMQKRAQDLAGSIDISTLFTTGGGKKTAKVDVEPVIVEGSLAEANKKVDELKKQLENMNPSAENFKEIQDELNKWQKKQEELTTLINGTKEAVKQTKNELDDIVTGSLAEANYFVKSFTEQLENTKPNTDEFDELLMLLNFWKDQQDKLTKSIEGTNKEIKKIKDGEDAVENFLHTYDKLAGASTNVVGSLNNVYETFKNVDDQLAECDNDWERFVVKFQAAINVFDTVANVMEGINTVLQIVNSLTAANTALTNKNTTSTAANTAAKASDAAANITAAGTEGAAAAASAGKSVASIPYVGPVLAIAAIATVMAAIGGIIASAKSYATGGIIEGSNTIGDYNIARVNSGEMILNGTQQKKLFNLLDSNTTPATNGFGTPQVEFKLRGQDLIGVINNTNKKRSKI